MAEDYPQWLCMYCRKAIPGVVSSRPCPYSPDEQHRRGEPWVPPGSDLVDLPIRTRHPQEYVLVDLRGHTWIWQSGTWMEANGVQRERAVRAIRRSDGSHRDPA